jgi:hypothetical protein
MRQTVPAERLTGRDRKRSLGIDQTVRWGRPMKAVSRRQFLMSATFVGGAGLVILAARRAFAFSIEQGSAEAKALYLDHCSANNQYHAELVAELTAKLQGHSQAEIEAAISTFRCPLCGCPIA